MAEVITQVKEELEGISVLGRSGNARELLEKAVDLSSLLATCNEHIAVLEHVYTSELDKWGQLLESSSAARIRAQAQPCYRDYKIALGYGKALERAIPNLRKLAERLIQEQQMDFHKPV